MAESDSKSSNYNIRVIVVSGDECALDTYNKIFKRSNICNCVGLFSTGMAVLSRAIKLDPDVVLIDFKLPDMTGIDCTIRLRKIQPDLKIIIVTGSNERSDLIKAMQIHADGFLTNKCSTLECLETIASVYNGNIKIAVELGSVEKFFDKQASSRTNNFPPLTDREWLVMDYVSQGLENKEIAEQLGVTIYVVQKLIHKIFLKLKVGNRTEAIKVWRSL